MTQDPSTSGPARARHDRGEVPPLSRLLREIRACRVCEAHLPHGPRPVVRLDRDARVMIVGQAPGAKVHASGVPWDDASGDHLIAWLGIDRPAFEDPRLFAIVPMGFCWPGRKPGGDMPPRPECAPTWHERILAELPRLELVLLVGQYAHARYLGTRARGTLGETVRRFADYLPSQVPLPHPSWRSKLWMKKNPWFEAELLPVLRARVRAILARPLGG